MIRTGGSLPADQRLVLRVWRSDVVLCAGATSLPLRTGTIVAERIDRAMWLASIAREQPNMNYSVTQHSQRSAMGTGRTSSGDHRRSAMEWFRTSGGILDPQPPSRPLVR